MKVKRLAAAALALVMVFGTGGAMGVFEKPLFAVTASAAPFQEYNGFKYTVEDTGKITIRGYTGTDTTVEIPSEIDEKKVTVIGVEAFKSNKNIKSVIVPEDVRYVMDDAFYGCKALEEIKLPKFLSYIGKNAFMDCTALKSISVPDQCEEIGEGAFGYVLDTMTDQPVKKEGFKVYCYPNSKGEEYANANGFDIEYLNYVHGDYEYRSNTDKSIKIMKYNGTAEKLDIAKDFDGDEVVEIAKSAFLGNSSLTSVKLPLTLKTIGANAFINCKSLNEITIPKNVSEIGTRALGYTRTYKRGKNGNRKVTYTKTAGFTVYGYKDSAAEKYAQENEFDFVYICGDYQYKIIDTEGNTEIVKYTGNESDAEIPAELEGAAVTSIGENAFMSNMSIKTLTIPEGVVNISKTAFVNCKNLEEITVPKSVSKIGEKAIGYFILFGNESKTDVTIKGYKGSAAETYAKDNEIKFVPLDEEDSSSKADSSTSSKADDNSSKPDSSSSGKADDSSSKPDSSSSGKADDSSSKADSSSSGKADDSSSKPNSSSSGKADDSSSKPDSSTSSKADDSSSKPDSNPDDTSKPDDGGTTDTETTSEEDKAIMKGDVNGDGNINVTDIAMVASHLKGVKPLTANQIKAADVNGDGDINVTDIAMIASHIKGIKAIPQ